MKTIIQHIRQSLPLKLSIGALLLACFIFAVSLGILYYQSRIIIKQETIDRAAIELRKVSLKVSNLLSTIETATESNYWLVTRHLTPDSLLTLSNRIVALNGNVNGCSITTEPDFFPQCGRYFSAYTIREPDSIITVREAPYEYFQKPWYKMPREIGKACWVDPFDDYKDGTLYSKDLIASYCKPLYDDHDQLIGVISTDISLNMLRKLVQEEVPYQGSYFIMVGHNGHYIVHPDSTKIITKSLLSDIDPSVQSDIIALDHQMTTGATGAQQVTINKRQYIVCYQPIKGTMWSIGLVCPEKTILHRYNNLSFIIIPLIAIGLVLISLFCYHIVHKATSPLKQLVEQSQRITDGMYDEQVPHTKRKDVVGRLQNSFASMQESLKRHIDQIQMANANTAKRNEELLRAQQMAEEAGRQKLAFIQNVTHQIRTPLNIIMGFAQVLNIHLGKMTPDELQPIFNTMLRNTASLSRMILMLYDSSEIGISKEKETFVFEDVSCNGIVRDCISHTYKLFPNVHITFETTLPDTFTIRTSYVYLLRSLREMLYNSAKFSDLDHIVVKASSVAPDTVRFVFEDKGPGIDENYLDKMFAPFTKIDDLSEGLGLGLPLVKIHIQALGGQITYDADYHSGCRFIIDMPISFSQSEGQVFD